MPSSPLPRASNAMMCSRDVNTTLPIATIPSLRMASRIGERLLAYLSIWRDVMGAVQVEFIYLLLGHKLVNVDGALALDCDGFEFFGIEFDVLALADLVAFDDVGGLDLVPALGINLAILDTVAGVLIDLMEADLLALRRSRKEGNRT